MKIKRHRNYLLAWVMCMVCTILAMMQPDTSWLKFKWYLLSDFNVSIWLFVAWLFDDTN